MIEWSDLLGPMGGTIALGYAAGSVSGWGFAQKTIVKYAIQQIKELKIQIERNDDDCEKRIDDLKSQVALLTARLHEIEESRINIALNRGASE